MANAVTVDEWQLGMPPSPTSLSHSHLLFFIAKITVFNICAVPQAAMGLMMYSPVISR